MRTRRHFQPIIDGLPCRIAPSAVAAASVSLVVSHGPSVPSMSPADTDMPETGVISPVLAGPPPSSGTGTLNC
jgi:hypothetical protein